MRESLLEILCLKRKRAQNCSGQGKYTCLAEEREKRERRKAI